MGIAELEQSTKAFEAASTEAKKLTEGLNEAQFNWRPAAGEWSIEECLEHLTVVGGWETRAIERAIDDAQARGMKSSGPFQYGWFDRWIVRMTEPPVRRKVRAPRHFVPIHEQPVTAVLPTFLHVQKMFLLQIERARDLDLARVKVETPISRFVRMSLGMMFLQAAAHERRHLDQARRVRDQIR
ncbi:MAG TPA: DinB family protein [Bryobacteraceae bacterium]|nr:DinB family protein [Bryobacteraceae bacterium]